MKISRIKNVKFELSKNHFKFFSSTKKNKNYTVGINLFDIFNFFHVRIL